MGLDQSFTARNPRTQEVTEFAYWRKHNALHGWMERLWRERGGEGEFNLTPISLSMEDLNNLEKDTENQDLPRTTGFFFGPDSSTDDYFTHKTLEFIELAKNYIEDGWEVKYSSSW